MCNGSEIISDISWIPVTLFGFSVGFLNLVWWLLVTFLYTFIAKAMKKKGWYYFGFTAVQFTCVRRRKESDNWWYGAMLPEVSKIRWGGIKRSSWVESDYWCFKPKIRSGFICHKPPFGPTSIRSFSYSLIVLEFSVFDEGVASLGSCIVSFGALLLSAKLYTEIPNNFCLSNSLLYQITSNVSK